MLGFRLMKTLQKFASVHANIPNRFSVKRRPVPGEAYNERAQPTWLISKSL
jgi:hypothetical protein